MWCVVVQRGWYMPRRIFIAFLMYLFVRTHATACVWKWEDNFQELVLSSQHVDPRDQTQVVKFGGRDLCLLCYLASSTQRFVTGSLTGAWDPDWMASESRIIERMRKYDHPNRSEGILKRYWLLNSEHQGTGVSLGVSHWRRKRLGPDASRRGACVPGRDFS